MLAGNTTALTVSVVLLLRKFTSLLLSMWLFNNRLSKTGSFGAFLVFFGAGLYSYASSQAKPAITTPPSSSREEIEFQDLKALDKNDIEKAKVVD